MRRKTLVVPLLDPNHHSNDSILGAPPRKPNPLSSQIPIEDKGKGIFHEAPKITQS